MARSKFSEWPREEFASSPDEIRALYERGYIGAFQDELGKKRLCAAVEDDGGWALAEDAISAFGLAGIGEGKLACLFPEVQAIWPSAIPGPAQQRGDCVSHSVKNTLLHSLAVECRKGDPDEVTGLREGAPEVPEKGQSQGVLSTEALYWQRGYNGDGWSCPTACRVAIKTAGCVVRKDYPEIGIDLTVYSGKLAGKYGSRKPPEEIQAVLGQHLARTATSARSFEEVRDLVAAGYAISTCGGEGWSSKRDENGFSRRSGSWSHALAIIAVDDRDVIRQKYGEPLVLILNSWGKWNSGGRTILGTDIQIPEGSFWAKWSDCRRRDFTALSSINGWTAKELDFLLI